MAVIIDIEKCTGCGRCLAQCPYGGVELVDGHARFTDRCTQCGACIDACRDGALSSDAAERPIPDFSAHSGVWVLAEQHQGRLHPVSLELLGRATQLAGELNQPVGAVLVGRDLAGLAPTLIAHGADEVHLVDHPSLADYLTRPHAAAAAQVVATGKPTILLVGATPQGRDLAPRLARRLGLGLTADCTELAIDPETKLLQQTRPAFGGNVMATIVSRYSRPQMASVRPGIMETLAADSARKGQVTEHDYQPAEEDLGAVLLRTMAAAGGEVDLASARVIVAGGRGVGGPEGFKALEKLAQVLGGEIAGTRVAFEEGWIPQARQIGQTGVTVRPELYIACGISGAIQHRAGIMDSRYIVAVNRDPGAPIFEVADFGLVGDLTAVVPALISALEERAAKEVA